MKKQNKYLLLFLSGAFLGAVMFFIVFGFRVLNPTYDDWIFTKGGDFAQHYLGWKFYRRSGWHFPVCLMEGLTGDSMVSCMFTDSIPLFAVFFKILSPVLPETFQYSGLWGFCCFFMMGGTSTLLLYRFNKNPVFCLCGSLFFDVSPAVIQRMFGHEGLAGQWLITAALIVWTYKDKWKNRATPIILFSVIGSASVLIHIYFVPMTYAVMLGYILTDLLRDKKIKHSLICFASTTCSVLFTMFMIGAFYGKGDMKAGGLGVYSANYNALFNPFGYSKFLKKLNYNNGQSEGLGYLGLGAIIALIIAFVVLVLLSEDSIRSFRDLRAALMKRHYIIIPVVVVMAVSMFMAASPVGTLNARTIYTIGYPEKIMDILGIFRASGRFVWIVDYIVYTAVFAIISRLGKERTVVSVMVLCLGIQMLDLRDLLIDKHKFFIEEKKYILALDESFDEFAEDAEEFVFLPLPENFNAKIDVYLAFGEYASRTDMNMSSFYMARPNYNALSAYAMQKYNELESGGGNERIVYVFFNEEEVPDNEHLTVRKFADFTVARYEAN